MMRWTTCSVMMRPHLPRCSVATTSSVGYPAGPWEPWCGQTVRLVNELKFGQTCNRSVSIASKSECVPCALTTEQTDSTEDRYTMLITGSAPETSNSQASELRLLQLNRLTTDKLECLNGTAPCGLTDSSPSCAATYPDSQVVVVVMGNCLCSCCEDQVRGHASTLFTARTCST